MTTYPVGARDARRLAELVAIELAPWERAALEDEMTPADLMRLATEQEAEERAAEAEQVEGVAAARGILSVLAFLSIAVGLVIGAVTEQATLRTVVVMAVLVVPATWFLARVGAR